MTTLFTLNDAVNERHLADALSEAKAIKKQRALDAKFTPRTDLHPSVGVLMSAKGVRYYAYVNGVYREGSPEHLLHLLTK